jgi:Flp pilus assembly protein TadD
MDEREVESVKLLIQSLMNAGRFAAARDLLAGLAETDAEDVFVQRNLVQAHLRLGDYEAAEPPARRLAEKTDGADEAPALFFHAYALWGCGRQDECRGVVAKYAESLNRN